MAPIERFAADDRGEREIEHQEVDLLVRVLAGTATAEEQQRAAELLARDPGLAEALRIVQEAEEP